MGSEYKPSRWVLTGLLALVALPVVVGGEPKTISFPAADGLRIGADYYPPSAGPGGSAPAIILIHMYNSDRNAWAPLVEPLHEAGFVILAIDLRGHGESATTETKERAIRRDPELFKEMQNDLRGAYDWLAAQPNIDRARFGLVGASLGCSVALQYAAADRSVDAVVCLSPELDYPGLDPVGDIGQVTGRRILMTATDDERRAAEELKTRTEGAEVRIAAGKARGTGILGEVAGIEKEIAAFLKTAVGEPTATTVCASIERNVYHQPDSGWVKQIRPTNLRYFSSPQEAEKRGLRAARSSGPDQPASRPSGQRRRGRSRS
jgi:pimeloyl-ACP methyl ester carboxylesterase